MKFNDYLTIKEAAKFLGVTQNTLRHWHAQKKLIPYLHPINNYRLYKKEDLEKILIPKRAFFEDSMEINSFDEKNEDKL